MTAHATSSFYLKKPLVIHGLIFLLFCILIIVSLSIGVADFSWQQLLSENSNLQLLLVSRLPRTLAIILTGASMAIGGLIMQTILKNRFVEPSMVGATQSSALAMLILTLTMPTLHIGAKMGISALFALAGMAVFVMLIRQLPKTDGLMIPLVGIVFSGILEAITTFVGYQTESLQILSAWQLGDFSAVLAGRYELLWLVGVLCVVAYILADRLTIVGLGDNIAKSLGINHEQILWIGICMVAMISAAVVTTVGAIPFIGLVVPNIVSRLMGDNLRLSLPAVAMLGACSVLICDIIGRVIRYPFEVPVATVFGVLGAVIFLIILFKKG